MRASAMCWRETGTRLAGIRHDVEDSSVRAHRGRHHARQHREHVGPLLDRVLAAMPG